MTLFVLSYLAGVLTILAPCILPVVPFVFARVDRPFVGSGLPLLAGMAMSFAAVATLATVGGAWAVEANEIGRSSALVVLAVCGATLLFPDFARRLMQPLVALGARLSAKVDPAWASVSNATDKPGRTVSASFGLGVATGLLWAPCAGPVLGLVLATAALHGASAHTAALLLAYAAGAATSLAFALWAGGRLLSALKRMLGFGEWLRRGLGVAVLAGVATVALGYDTQLLVRFGPAGGGFAVEQRLLDSLGPPHTDTPAAATPSTTAAPAFVSPASSMTFARGSTPDRTALRNAVFIDVAASDFPVEGLLPSLAGATGWVNGAPINNESLRGKVVLVDIWTFGCINCQRAIPYVRGWAEKYKDQGLVTLGVHSPEFAFERRTENIKRAVDELKLRFPIAIDNDFAIWRGFNNQYWPALYLIDAQGRIRYHHFGEGQYERSEQVIRQLLDEARNATPKVT